MAICGGYLFLSEEKILKYWFIALCGKKAKKKPPRIIGATLVAAANA